MRLNARLVICTIMVRVYPRTIMKLWSGMKKQQNREMLRLLTTLVRCIAMAGAYSRIMRKL